MYQLLSGKTIKLRLACMWVKCRFSSAATSAFYTFKIRTSAGPQIRILPPALDFNITGMTNYHIGPHRTRSDHIGAHRNGLYKPRTGRFMNHAPAILAAPALIYSKHRLFVVWIIVVHFHLCSLLDRYTTLEV